MTDPERLSALNAPRVVSQQTEIETFLARGNTLYRQHRDAMLDAERAYQAERFALCASFDKRAQALVAEREDALRDLDSKRHQAREIADRKLSALDSLRDA